MKRSDQDRLLENILADDALDRRRAATLTAMLGAVRRRRQRRTLLTSAAGMLALAFGLAAVIQRRAAEPLAPAPAPRLHPSAVAVISDEQLLTLFAHRPVALIGRAGEQRLMFLDEPRASSSATQTR